MAKKASRHVVVWIGWLVVGGAVAGMAGSSSAADPPKAEAKARSKKPAPGKAKTDPTKWRSLFDGKSLKGWKAPQFGGEGKVVVKDGSIQLERGDMMTGIAYAGGDFPKMDYEVSLEGKRVDGNDFFCTTTFPVGDSFCSLVTGGWGGSVVGLSSIDYYDASDNMTTKFKDFKTGQWYKFRIRVTKDKIQAWVDDEQTVDLETKGHKISIRFECDLCKPFGVASWCTTGAVRDIRVRALTDAEKKSEPKKEP